MALQGRATVRSTKVSTTLTTAARREEEVEMSVGVQVEGVGEWTGNTSNEQFPPNTGIKELVILPSFMGLLVPFSVFPVAVLTFYDESYRCLCEN